jgi:hypothetical protein
VAGSGFKIADAYVAVTLDRSALVSDLEKLPAELTPAAEKAGNSTGKSLGKGMKDGADGKKVAEDVLDDVDKAAQPKATTVGKNTGDKMSKAMKDAQTRGNPLIVAAIAGGLMAGGPVILGAAGVLFAGIAAVAVHGNAQVSAAFQAMAQQAENSIKGAASVTVPFFMQAIAQLNAGVQSVTPLMRNAFAALGPAISDVTQGVVNLARNALPGITSALAGSAPLFAGLQSMLGQIGTGLGNMFSILGQHSGEFGSVFATLGSAVSSLLTILGQLLVVGGKIANEVLPPLAGALKLVADVLGFLSPILPAVVAGIAGLMVAKSLAGPLDKLANGLANLGTAGTGAGLGVLSIAKALPAVLAIIAVAGQVWAAGKQQVDDWGQALLNGGKAAEQASAQMQHYHDVTQSGLSGLHSLSDYWDRAKALTMGYTDAQQKAADQAQQTYNAMDPLQQRQQDVTKAQNDLNYAVGTWGANSGQAVGAAVAYRDAQDALASAQEKANQAAQQAALAVPGSTQALQALSNQASAANTQISLLKGALDELTGKSTTSAQAQIGFTQAVVAATTATQGHTGALVDNAGHLLTTTDRGAAATQAFIQMASAGHQVISVMQQQGASSADVSSATEDLRNRMINAATQMGYTKAQAQQLADTYYGIPGQIDTTIGVSTSGVPQAAAAIDYAARTRFSTIYTTVAVGNGHAGQVATGGSIGQMRVIARAVGGRVEGPGSDTSDSVGPFPTEQNVPAYLSNDEWIIKAASARKYGDQAMAAVNAGTATITTPGAGSADSSAKASSGGQITVQNLNVSVAGTLDFADPAAIRNAAIKIRDALVRLEREQR